MPKGVCSNKCSIFIDMFAFVLVKTLLILEIIFHNNNNLLLFSVGQYIFKKHI